MVGVGLVVAGAMPASANEPEPRKISAGQAAILGVVEGLTEYLPVSSTGHLILVNHAMGLSHFTDPAHPLQSGIEKVPAVDAFDIVIQLGAILAVLGLYRKRVGQMLLGLAGRDPAGLRLAVSLLIAFLPAAVVGVALHRRIKEHLFNPVSVIAALAVGGVLMIVVEHYFGRLRLWTLRGRRDAPPFDHAQGGPSPDRIGIERPRVTDVAQTRYWQALVIGLAQVLAMWPGTSRSMITILAALVIGLDMLAAAEFSFLLALPTLGAATVYEGAKSWHDLTGSVGVDGMVIGLVVSGVVAALAVKGFVRWLTRHGLLPFGLYRLGLAAAVCGYFMWSAR
ncbi:MAG: undecaprenyl-diphosphate phosphatase [Planctomycetota bacterium]|nr:undecaprenyl-diphosphate phosphatase [Planctomycetota bacterium]